MFQSYEAIFSKHADAYQKAMELHPTARDREFQLAVEAAEIKAGETVCDAPSGGGYLRTYLPTGVHRYLAVETAHDFAEHCPMGPNDRTIQSSLDQIETEDQSVDVCINLAGAYHLEDMFVFFAKVFRMLRSGGRFVMANVATAESIQQGIETTLGFMSGSGNIKTWPGACDLSWPPEVDHQVWSGGQ